MVKTALRGKGTRGGAGRGKEPAGERGASGGGGSGRGLSVRAGSGRGGAGGKAPAPEYIPLGELAAIAATRTAKARGKRPTGTSEPVVRPETTCDPVVRPVPTRPNPGASSVACEGATNAGGSPVARPISNAGSCNSSNPSPPSQGTRVSHSNLSAARTIPLQYPPSTNPQGEVQPLAEADDEEDEEDRDDEEELQDDAVENDELGPVLEAVAGQQPQGLDDEQLLANLLALPGRQRLPLLSEVPVPDSLWFTRDRGKLTRVISTIFRRKFDGPFFSWTVTPIDKQERYFRTFASKYYWDQEITELVREHFNAIAINRMKGIVSRAKTSKIRPIWIDGDLWKEMWLHWDTTEAIERSTTASNSRNSDRNGLGPHKHRSGQSSYLTIQQDMEDALGRPVSFAEVFKHTHTLSDGSYVDQKAKQVYEDYDKTLQEVREQARGEGPDASDDSENTTQRQLTVDDLNDIFLKVTFLSYFLIISVLVYFMLLIIPVLLSVGY